MFSVLTIVVLSLSLRPLARFPPCPLILLLIFIHIREPEVRPIRDTELLARLDLPQSRIPDHFVLKVALEAHIGFVGVIEHATESYSEGHASLPSISVMVKLSELAMKSVLLRREQKDRRDINDRARRDGSFGDDASTLGATVLDE